LATDYVFNSTGALNILRDGYFYPGDIGRFTADGALEILSRTGTDLLNFDGIKLNAAIIDAILTSVDGILGAATLQSPKANSSEVVAFAEFAPGTNRMQTVEFARKACSDAFGPTVAPVRIWSINTIPRKTDGSPDREECANLLRQAIAAAERP
jgi:acyl-CoA synthetase (AMP-forming)/AMP-acid ligase II